MRSLLKILIGTLLVSLCFSVLVLYAILTTFLFGDTASIILTLAFIVSLFAHLSDGADHESVVSRELTGGILDWITSKVKKDA